jgi:peptidoglycan/xylan/chitin deacetylase (PgdA/CDA1 family)
MTVLATASTVGISVALGSFYIGHGLKHPASAPGSAAAKVADAESITGTIPAPGAPAPNAPQPATMEPASSSSAAADRANVAALTGTRASPSAEVAPSAGGRAGLGEGPSPACAGNSDALGVSRVVEIDTTGGPGFGFEQFKAYDFLEPQEVVLTFDDGPWPVNTPAVLAALAAQCTKATFFPIGKHATWHPEILKQVVAAGHSIGSHTWSHADLGRKSLEEGKEEIEKGISAVAVSAGQPLAPFFRFPALRMTPELLTYLGQRNVAIFSADLDSFDFKLKKPEQVIESVMTKLNKRGKGIILMHDFQRSTAIAMPQLLAQLKAGGYKIVELTAKERIATLPQYDADMVKSQAGQTADARPTASVVRTISTYMSERQRP